MEGWKLNDGKIVRTNLDDNEIISIVNSFLFSEKYKTTTYKFCLFKIILDNIFNLVDDEIKFENIAYDFSKIYWNLVAVHHLPQKNPSSQSELSAIEKKIDIIVKKYPESFEVDFDSISESIKKEYLDETSSIVIEYAIGSLYTDFNCSIFGFSKKEKKIYFSKNVIDFFQRFKLILEKINYFQWIQYIEKVYERKNVSTTLLYTKLDEANKRINLEKYKKQLEHIIGIDKCFYCGCSLKNKIHLDHFVPWSFVKEDNLWNFVFSCEKCNTSKNNKLADINYLNQIIERNSNYDLSDSMGIKIKNLYDKAIFNGMQIWKNK